MPSTRQSIESEASRQSQVPGGFPSDPISPGFNAQRHLAREVFERRKEYVKQKRLRVKIGSWNVAACSGTEKDIQGWFVDGKGISKLHGGLPTGAKVDDSEVEDAGTQEARVSKKVSTIPEHDSSRLPTEDEIDLYALGLQEIIDINSAAEALRPYNDAGPAGRWKDAVSEALPDGYVLVAEQQLLGLMLLIYASPSIAPTISSVSTTSVGTGLMGYMGNKGAVSARIVLGETTKMVFVNSHLAAGNDKASLERRNWDASQIIQRTRFAPIDHGHGVIEDLGDYIGAEDFAFWFGDLNYRLADIPGDDVRRLLLLHTRNEYDQDDKTRATIDRELNIKEDPVVRKQAEEEEQLNPDEDPSSALTTINSLLTHDQLRAQMKAQKAFHQGWQEAPITFLPTYKYDVGSVGMFDSSEKKRSPSWCDRILFRTKKQYQAYLQQEKALATSRKRDEEMKARGLEEQNEEAFFEYDPEADGENEDEPDANGIDGESDETRAMEDTSIESHGSIDLEYYVSHQRVLSSDHKPLDAICTVEYDAVDNDLRSKVHQEVAKEIDRQENEGRPSVTAIFESSDLHEKSFEGCEFGELRFLQEKVVLLTVANTSPVVATFEFLDRTGTGRMPVWLRISDHEVGEQRIHRTPLKAVTLQPGDSANLEVAACIHDSEHLHSFNSGTTKPEDVLVLRVHKGRDHFIPIHARWMRSIFGLSLDQLIRVDREGIRKDTWDLQLESKQPQGSAPRELFRLTEALEEALSEVITHQDAIDLAKSKGSDWPFIFRPIEDVARDSQALAIREALDTATPIVLDNVGVMGRVELLAQTIVLFLSYMPGRIISQSLWTSISAALSEHDKARQSLQGEELRSQVLDILSASPAVSVSFTFITFMLSRIASDLVPEEKDPPAGDTPETPMTPRTPTTLLSRAKSLSLKGRPVKARKVQIQSAFADRFLPLIFDAETPTVSNKSKRAEDDRKKTVLLAFIKSRDEE